MARPSGGVVRLAVGVWGGWVLLNLLWRLPGLVGFFVAVADGRAVGASVFTIPSMLLWVVIDLWLVALAWGVFKGRGAARTRLLVFLGLIWAFVFGQALLGGAPSEAGGVVSILLSPWFLKDLLIAACVELLDEAGG